jgi:peptidoglycan/LPS O-acetylase OafA/YrhL
MKITMSDLEINSAEKSKSKAISHPDAQYKTDTGKLDYIDALRGIAALSILVFHIYGTIGMITGWAHPIQIVPERFFDLALAGIPLFFIISAFTLYLSLDNKADEKRMLFKFYLRRFFRIAPLFYFLLILVVLDGIIIQKRVPSWLEVLANFSFTFNLVPQYSKSLFSDGWTVGVEMLFYLVLPFIFLKVNNIWRSILLFIGIYWLSKGIRQLMGTIIGVDVMTSTNYDFYTFFHWAYIFPLGIICYLIYKLHLPKMRCKYRAPVAYILLSVSLIILFIFIDNLSMALALSDLYEPLSKLTELQIMSPIAFVLLILSLSLAPNRFIVNRFTQFFGMISYSLYLVHPFLVEPLKPAYVYIYDHTIYSTDFSLLLCLLLTLLVVTPISLLTYHLIETPGIRWGKKIIAKL